jgi:hypothetical protein
MINVPAINEVFKITRNALALSKSLSVIIQGRLWNESEQLQEMQ